MPHFENVDLLSLQDVKWERTLCCETVASTPEKKNPNKFSINLNYNIKEEDSELDFWIPFKQDIELEFDS